MVANSDGCQLTHRNNESSKSEQNGFLPHDSISNGHANGEIPLSVGDDEGVEYRKIGVANVEPPPHLRFKNVDGKKVKRDLVGIDGKWYDVTNFIDKHPGGPIIERFLGKDATDVFHAYRHIDITSMRKPVGTYEIPVRHPSDADFRALIKEFEERGFYETDFYFYAGKLFFGWTLFTIAISCVVFSDVTAVHYIGSVFLAWSWHQLGFLMHEFMHGQIFRKPFWDRLFGLICGSFTIGFSAHWWQDEHVLHHALTNVVDVDKKWADPQMWEASWAQNTRLFPLYTTALDWIAIKIQHITFIPLVVLYGRFEIVQDSTKKERRWYELLALTGHWIWMIWLLRHLGSWQEIFTFYMIATIVEGGFHFQLILSHYASEFLMMDEFHETSWYVAMVLSNLNINCPWWFDWYYGGLNTHIEHHLFPKLGRKHLRYASGRVREICEKHKIDYVSLPFLQALWITLKYLKNVGKHFKLDPR